MKYAAMRQVKQRLDHREVFAYANVKRSVPRTSEDTSRYKITSLRQQLHMPSGTLHFQKKKTRCFRIGFSFSGAGDEARTRYLHLGKVALYRMSYTRIWGCSSEHDAL